MVEKAKTGRFATNKEMMKHLENISNENHHHCKVCGDRLTYKNKAWFLGCELVRNILCEKCYSEKNVRENDNFEFLASCIAVIIIFIVGMLAGYASKGVV